jgi:hypothetical protein
MSSAVIVTTGEAVSIWARGISEPVTVTVSNSCASFFFLAWSADCCPDWSVASCATADPVARVAHKPMMMDDTSNLCFIDFPHPVEKEMSCAPERCGRIRKHTAEDSDTPSVHLSVHADRRFRSPYGRG